MITEVEALSYRRRYRGLIGVKSKMPIRDMSVLSRSYTPGVGAVCREIEKHPVASDQLTCRGNAIALISDGSAGYEYGNIGALAVLPKLEAKSVIYKTFANVDAVPIALATQDADGCLTLVGRTCEVINTGGEKVVPGEVEQALRGIAVDDLVVVGAPDRTWGETVVAVVACRAECAPTLEQVRAAAGATLARYKMPTRIVVLAELPHTASGKVDRAAVRALITGGVV